MFNDPDLMQQLSALLDIGNRKGFFNLVHKTIKNNPDAIFEDDGVDIVYKKMQLKDLLEYFKEIEDYNKCADIRDWLKMIEKHCEDIYAE